MSSQLNEPSLVERFSVELRDFWVSIIYAPQPFVQTGTERWFWALVIGRARVEELKFVD